MLRRAASSTLMVLPRFTATTTQSRTCAAAAAISRGAIVASFRPANVPIRRPLALPTAWGSIKFPLSHSSPGSRGLLRTFVVQAKKANGRGGGGKMPRGVKKENLPSKVCVVCNRPFTWRKKWERCWDEVTTCSKSCNAKRRAANKSSSLPSTAVDCHSDDGIDETADETAAVARTTKGAAETASDAPKSADAGSKATNAALGAVDPDGVAEQEDADGSSSSADDCASDGPAELSEKEMRKAAKKAAKAARRAQREGHGNGGAGQKKCDGCDSMVDLLIRCTVDESGKWNMMCGKCWRDVSGGVADGDADHPHYKYGGLWKNRRAAKNISTTPPALQQLVKSS